MSQLRNASLPFFKPDTIYNAQRTIFASVSSGTIFLGSGIGLYQAWYSKFDQAPFHFFDDRKEWKSMDKYGHIYTGNMQSEMCFKVARWAGHKKKHAIVYGMTCGFVLQSTVEFFDAYSEQWGFSVADFGANIIGVAAFGLQQFAWDEQRIRLKISSTLGRKYPELVFIGSDGTTSMTLEERLDNLYGPTVLQRFLKDYNAQSYWLSINPHSFGLAKFPDWLNLSFGIGAENLLGGFDNTWSVDAVNFYYPAERYTQFYFSPDINFENIKVKNHFVKTFFSMLNVYKLPMPAVEYNRVHGWSFHLMLVN